MFTFIYGHLCNNNNKHYVLLGHEFELASGGLV